MRTLTQMVARTQRYLNDEDAQEWTDAEVAEALEDAADSFWTDLVGHGQGRELLRKWGSETSFVAETEEYALPADLLELESVEVRWYTTDDRWDVLPKQAPPLTGWGVSSGAVALFGTRGGGGVSGYGWYDDCAQGYIRIWPYLTSVSDEVFRFVYFHKPTFPAGDDDAFTGVPDGADRCVEYLAAALLGQEELENGKVVGVFGQRYEIAYRRYGAKGAKRLGVRRRVARTRW